MNSPFLFRILAATLLWSSLTIATEPSAQEKEFIRRALATMQDIAPRVPVQAPFLQIHAEGCHGWWGNLFGDAQPAALIAVEPQGNGKNDQWDAARLFLLLWKNGWQLAQQIGPVAAWRRGRWLSSGSFDQSGAGQPWSLKITAEPRKTYLLSHLQPNTATDQQSWLLDPSVHQSKPAGWPGDATAAISAQTITLTRWSPNQPKTKTVHHFEGTIGAEIITIREDYDAQHLLTATLTQPALEDRPPVEWLIRRQARGYAEEHDRYSICRRSPPAAAATPFEEHAVIEFSWPSEHGDESAASYLFHRLTGLGRAAYDGQWDQDQTRKLLQPKSVKVTGDPEAVTLFSLDPK